jgi:hypothetical protein
MNNPDIVVRLRESDGGYFMRQMFTEAADEIERLRIRLEEERAWREDADLRLFRLKSEIECRIEHGANSNMHLEGLRNLWMEGNL